MLAPPAFAFFPFNVEEFTNAHVLLGTVYSPKGNVEVLGPCRCDGVLLIDKKFLRLYINFY